MTMPYISTYNSSIPAEGLVQHLLEALQEGELLTFWEYTHELYRGRPVNGHGNFTTFASRARQSEIGALLGCSLYSLEPVNAVGDGSKYMTQVARVWPASESTKFRRYLFQLRREMRPPYNGGWSVWGVIVSDGEGAIQDLSGGF